MSRHFTWVAVIQWVLLTLPGLLLAGGLHFPGGYGTNLWSQHEFGLGSGVLGLIFGAVSGLFIAGPQALVLRAWGGPARRWLAYNVLAFGLIHAVADAFAYRPFITFGGGPVLALCQFLALRRSLTRPLWWLPIVTLAWWLGLGFSQGLYGYSLLAFVLVLGLVTALGLRWLLIPGPRPAPLALWARLNRWQRALLVVVLVILAALFLVLFAGLSGLTGMFSA
jgi:hypothetical protein